MQVMETKKRKENLKRPEKQTPGNSRSAGPLSAWENRDIFFHAVKSMEGARRAVT
jgi:hypothetical protein